MNIYITKEKKREGATTSLFTEPGTCIYIFLLFEHKYIRIQNTIYTNTIYIIMCFLFLFYIYITNQYINRKSRRSKNNAFCHKKKKERKNTNTIYIYTIYIDLYIIYYI